MVRMLENGSKGGVCRAAGYSRVRGYLDYNFHICYSSQILFSRGENSGMMLQVFHGEMDEIIAPSLFSSILRKMDYLVTSGHRSSSISGCSLSIWRMSIHFGQIHKTCCLRHSMRENLFPSFSRSKGMKCSYKPSQPMICSFLKHAPVSRRITDLIDEVIDITDG